MFLGRGATAPQARPRRVMNLDRCLVRDGVLRLQRETKPGRGAGCVSGGAAYRPLSGSVCLLTGGGLISVSQRSINMLHAPRDRQLL